MNFIQPSIDPVIISFGFVDIRWYSLAYILGLIIGLVILEAKVIAIEVDKNNNNVTTIIYIIAKVTLIPV